MLSHEERSIIPSGCEFSCQYVLPGNVYEHYAGFREDLEDNAKDQLVKSCGHEALRKLVYKDHSMSEGFVKYALHCYVLSPEQLEDIIDAAKKLGANPP